MSDKATILIPDISGFTEFVSHTELDHASHITNELLSLIIDSNSVGLTLSEIEGDAVLFYKKGEAISSTDLVKQCLEMFEAFHARLRLIERDTICRCGACQSASDLSLKFVVHRGAIKEFEIRGFTKASGVDMIIAHRLLKNDIDSNEYILASSGYLADAGEPPSTALKWLPYKGSYPGIGDVECEFARLEALRKSIPDPPPPPPPPPGIYDKTIEIEIDARYDFVYGAMIDLDLRSEWTVGYRGTEADPETARIGHHHVCLLDDINITFEIVAFETTDDSISYTEKGMVEGMPVGDLSTYRFARLDDDRTRLTLEHSWLEGFEPPAEIIPEFHESLQESLRLFKIMCEKRRPYPGS
ncbi:MAG: DUF2652 domain-containing protein [Rhodothermia bacterium]